MTHPWSVPEWLESIGEAFYIILSRIVTHRVMLLFFSRLHLFGHHLIKISELATRYGSLWDINGISDPRADIEQTFDDPTEETIW